MSLPSLFSLLGENNVKPAGRDKWTIRCPVHGDKDYAMSVRLNDDGSVVAHCFSCGANGYELYTQLGADLNELFGKPLERSSDFVPQKTRDNLLHERLVEAIANEQSSLSFYDKKRLRLARARIEGILQKYPSLS